MTEHEVFMQRAIELAKEGLYTASPNPRVGCVLVRSGSIIGEGFHLKAGEPHAEVNALQSVMGDARGATAYVTLEPCSHQGKTGPCAQALLAAGISQVVFGMEDPNPLVAGQGLAQLKAAGVTVVGPVLQEAAKALNPGFIKRMTTGKPWVRVKIAASLDGRTAMPSGESQWITSGHARQDVQHWRARSCAIVTGVASVLSDDPALTVRAPEFGAHPRQPLRVIVDSRLRTPDSAQILVGGETVIATCAFAQPGRYGVPVWGLAGKNGRVDLEALVTRLANEQCNEVMVEAGPTLAGAFVSEGLVDELVVYLAPKLLGSEARPMMQLPLSQLSEAIEWQMMETSAVGPDIRLILQPKGK